MKKPGIGIDRGLYYYLPRLISAVAIVVLILGFSLKLTSSETDQVRKNWIPTPVVTKGLKPDLQGLQKQLVSSDEAGIDLNGPWICSYSDKKTQAEVFIKDKKLFARIKKRKGKSFILAKGNCIYLWEEEKYSGNKVCDAGISLYMDIINRLLSLKIINPKELISILSPTENKLVASDGGKVNQLVNLCKKKNFPNSRFDLPKRVLFKKIRSLTPVTDHKK